MVYSQSLESQKIELWCRNDLSKWGETLTIGNGLDYVDGTLIIDFNRLKGGNAKMASLNIPFSNLESNAEYEITFEYQANKAGSVFPNYPEPDPEGKKDDKGNLKPKSTWMQLKNDGKWTFFSDTFIFDPSINKGTFGIFFRADQIEGLVLKIKSLKIEKVEKKK